MDDRPVFNQDTFYEFCMNFQADKTELIMTMFKTQLSRGFAVLRNGADMNDILFEAHGLAASAGMLGFELLHVASDRMQRWARVGSSPDDLEACGEDIVAWRSALMHTASAVGQ